MLFALVSTAGPTREQMVELSAFQLQLACLMQSSTHRDSQLGKFFASRPGFAGWENLERSSISQCLRKHQWLSEALCSDLMSTNLQDTVALTDLLKRRKADLLTADTALEYMGKAQDAQLFDKPQPPCPEAEPNKPLQPIAPKDGASVDR